VNGLRRTYVSHQGRYTDRHRKLYAAVWRLVADPASEGVEAAVPKSTRETAEVVEQLRWGSNEEAVDFNKYTGFSEDGE
jgi:hypothetical protein